MDEDPLVGDEVDDLPDLVDLEALLHHLLDARAGALDGDHAAVHASLFEQEDQVLVEDVSAEAVGEGELEVVAALDDPARDALRALRSEVEDVVHEDELFHAVLVDEEVDLGEDVLGRSLAEDLAVGVVAVGAAPRASAATTAHAVCWATATRRRATSTCSTASSSGRHHSR